ncbi:MAG TPA: hypothetical protein VFV45_05070 [Rubrobacteraceae bacterium]|nr:hypothetical protein [Rubrobacteraceae bacterium]
MSDDVKPGPLFKDSLDGGRSQKTLEVARGPRGFLFVEMVLGAGRDSVGLSHPLHREEVAALCEALQTWLESPESVMVGDEPAPTRTRAAERTCGTCLRSKSQCVCVSNGWR